MPVPLRATRPRDVATGSIPRPTLTELDDLAREIVFLRDGRRCRRCGTTDGLLDWAHIMPRNHKATRWSSDNALVLCRRCHNESHGRFQKGRPDSRQFEAWLHEEVGGAKLRELAMRASNLAGDRRLVKIALLAELKRARNGRPPVR